MMPTIILKNDKPFMVLGAPGGPVIITAVLQVILNVIDFGMNPQDAIDFPRVHDQWKPDRLDTEAGVSPDTVAQLQRMGHQTQMANPGEHARVEVVLISDGWVQGAHDGRGSGGKADGY